MQTVFLRFFGVQNLDIFVAPISIVFGFELILRLYCPLLMDFESKNCILRVSKFDPKFGLQSIHEPWRAGSPQKFSKMVSGLTGWFPPISTATMATTFWPLAAPFTKYHFFPGIPSSDWTVSNPSLLPFPPSVSQTTKNMFSQQKHTNNKH